MSDKAVIHPAALRAPTQYFSNRSAAADAQRHFIKPRAFVNTQRYFSNHALPLTPSDGSSMCMLLSTFCGLCKLQIVIAAHCCFLDEDQRPARGTGRRWRRWPFDVPADAP
ncbi:hypothetical protein [Paraburkholderia sp. D1E]|uniref:hypothetical protein n=1 Tax=Paraburkholderia sp. D1E TaxID=3461398 RepID=UPI0040456D8B